MRALRFPPPLSLKSPARLMRLPAEARRKARRLDVYAGQPGRYRAAPPVALKPASC